MGDAIRVNGFSYGWGSLVFKLGNDRFYGFTDVGFGEKREHGLGYSMARHHAPYIRSPGKYTPEILKVSGWKRSVHELREALAARSTDGISYGNVIFGGVLQYIEPDETEVTIDFDRLVWQSNAFSHTESPDPLKADFELQYMFMRVNGKTLFDASAGMP